LWQIRARHRTTNFWLSQRMSNEHAADRWAWIPMLLGRSYHYHIFIKLWQFLGLFFKHSLFLFQSSKEKEDIIWHTELQNYYLFSKILQHMVYFIQIIMIMIDIIQPAKLLHNFIHFCKFNIYLS
jgi:hypothetical protein